MGGFMKKILLIKEHGGTAIESLVKENGSWKVD